MRSESRCSLIKDVSSDVDERRYRSEMSIGFLALI
jgi:hypothetical protein